MFTDVSLKIPFLDHIFPVFSKKLNKSKMNAWKNLCFSPCVFEKEPQYNLILII